MKIDKKKVTILLALTLLITSLLLVNPNGPTSAQPSTDPIHLHGPSLQPIHMHSNITLNPIHMHHTEGILWPGVPPITEPNCTTNWIRIEPEGDPIDFELWHLTSWEDWGEPFEELSQNDQIDMNNTETGKIEWFHVDRMTLTLNLSGPYHEPYHEPGPTAMLLELKQPYCSPYDPYIVDSTNQPNFSFTLWHQVWPIYSPVYQITNWMDDPSNPNGVLDFTDSISFDFGFNWYHVEDVATDLILRWKMMDPIGTWWHELYPDYCEWYNLTSWSSFPDPWCDRISPKDTIDMFRLSDQTTHWYFVDRVTITINVTSVEPPFDWMMLELKTHDFEEMYHWIKKPLGSLWHEVHPVYSTVFDLTWWDPMEPLWDNCNGVLDPCDHIELKNMTDHSYMVYHITDMSYDIILNEYITDPVCTDWHELHPDCTLNEYHINNWQNNTMDVWLSPCDNVTLIEPTGLPGDYHVENVTLTLNVTVEDIIGSGPFNTIGERIYLEYIQGAWNYSWPRLYHPKIEPWNTSWTAVCPTQYFGENLEIGDWFDNCNGVLDYCDWLVLYYPDVTAPTQSLYVHVDEVAVDMVVQKMDAEEVCGVEITNVNMSHCGNLVNQAYKTWTVNVSVTIHNNGTIPTNCTVNAYYYNATFTQQIETSKNVTNLDPCNTATLIFSWNFSILPVGFNYTVKANATCTCGGSDEFVNGLIEKIPWGDVNNNGLVGFLDFGDVGKMYLIYSGVIVGPPDLIARGDINGNCVVGSLDFGDVGKMYLIYSGVLS